MTFSESCTCSRPFTADKECGRALFCGKNESEGVCVQDNIKDCYEVPEKSTESCIKATKQSVEDCEKHLKYDEWYIYCDCKVGFKGNLCGIKEDRE